MGNKQISGAVSRQYHIQTVEKMQAEIDALCESHALLYRIARRVGAIARIWLGDHGRSGFAPEFGLEILEAISVESLRGLEE